MPFTRQQIADAAAAAGLAPEACDRLLAALPDDASSGGALQPARAKPRFDLTHLLWYGGALIVLGAMTLFATLAFAQMGAVALTFTALVYAAVFLVVGDQLWRRGLTTPGGLMVAIAVGMAPMAVFGIQDSLGAWGGGGDPGSYRSFYTWIHGSWVPMELATLVAGAVALVFYRFPFIVAILAFMLWFLSMDLAPLLFHGQELGWEQRRDFSLWFGVGLIVFAWAVDLAASRSDFAFWLHLVAAVTFWGGLTLQDGGSEWTKALYCLINVGLVLLAIFLERRVYAVFGAIGICVYLGYLVVEVFADSLLFPFVLSAIGAAVMASGVMLYPRRQRIAGFIDRTLPAPLKRLRPAHAQG
ncbi:hypothetical protein V5F77_07040 [Xanthobacter sp. DSM 24535]|uniref:hypothetical protein n=1 Tax=Roseixanthobacter psychrophilus TaxID=3119917 RepID=UPI00372AFB02